MDKVLKYYEWLLENAYIYKSNNSKDIYDEVKDSLNKLDFYDEDKFPTLKEDFEYIMNDDTNIDDVIKFLEARISDYNEKLNNVYYVSLIEDNALLKKLHVNYVYLESSLKRFSDCSENDFNFCEIKRVIKAILDLYNKGYFDDLKDIYSNLGDVFAFDYESIMQSKDKEFLSKLLKTRISDFSSFNEIPEDEDKLRCYNEFFSPIIDECRELYEYCDYDKIKGFNHFIIEFGDVKLHVYQNPFDLFVSKNELSSSFNNILVDDNKPNRITINGDDFISIRNCKYSDIENLINGKKIVL